MACPKCKCEVNMLLNTPGPEIVLRCVHCDHQYQVDTDAPPPPMKDYLENFGPKPETMQDWIDQGLTDFAGALADSMSVPKPQRFKIAKGLALEGKPTQAHIAVSASMTLAEMFLSVIAEYPEEVLSLLERNLTRLHNEANGAEVDKEAYANSEPVQKFRERLRAAVTRNRKFRDIHPRECLISKAAHFSTNPCKSCGK